MTKTDRENKQYIYHIENEKEKKELTKGWVFFSNRFQTMVSIRWIFKIWKYNVYVSDVDIRNV